MKIKSIKYNFFMNVLSTITNLIFPLITYPYVTRILSSEGLGKVSFATSVASYFIMFACLGIPTYGIRECAKVRDDKNKLSIVVHELLTINLITTVISVLFFLILTFKIPKFYAEKELMYLNIVYVFLNTIGINWLYTALEQYTYITVRSILIKIISFVFIFVLIKQQADYIIYASITIVATSGSNIFNFINAKKYVNFKPYSIENLRRHIKPIIVFFLQSVTLTLSNNIDSTLLGLLATNSQVGYYSTAIRIKSILLSIINSLGWVLIPRMTYYFKNNMKKNFIDISYKVISFIVIISIPLIVFFVIYSKETILILAGSDFIGAIIPMQIIMFTLLFQGLSNMFGTQILTPIGKEKYVVKSLLFGIVIDIVLDIILIEKYGTIGVSVANLVSQIIIFVVQYLYIRKMLDINTIKNSILKVIVSAFLSAIITANLSINVQLELLFSFILYGIVYFTSYILLLILFKEKYTYDEIMKIKNKYFHND